MGEAAPQERANEGQHHHKEAKGWGLHCGSSDGYKKNSARSGGLVGCLAVLPVWQWWARGLWGSLYGLEVNPAGRCGSPVGAHKTMSGSWPSLSVRRSSRTPHPASPGGAGLISPTHTSVKSTTQQQAHKTKQALWDSEHGHKTSNNFIFFICNAKTIDSGLKTYLSYF